MPAPSRQTGVSDGPLYFLSARRVPRLRARVTFGRSGPLHRLSLCLRRPHFFQQRKKRGKERRQKPMVFGIPFVRSQLRRKKAHAESLLPLSPLPLPRAAGKCRILPPWNSVPPRGTRRRFSAHPSRAGSLETCGFKQRFWSLLGLRPKVTHARKCGVLPSKKRMSGPSRTTPIPAKSISPSKKGSHALGRGIPVTINRCPA